MSPERNLLEVLGTAGSSTWLLRELGHDVCELCSGGVLSRGRSERVAVELVDVGAVLPFVGMYLGLCNGMACRMWHDVFTLVLFVDTSGW